jgi:late competence protein required for DNA uptake (superfamily II DNA/RNA helicase)
MAQSVEKLTSSLQFARKQKAFAWAKYYEQVNGSHHADHDTVIVYERIVEDASIPVHIKDEMRAMAVALKKKWECPICREMIDDGELEITNCGHYYCKPCLKQHIAHQALEVDARNQPKKKWDCAICKRKHNFKEDDS